MLIMFICWMILVVLIIVFVRLILVFGLMILSRRRVILMLVILIRGVLFRLRVMLSCRLVGRVVCVVVMIIGLVWVRRSFMRI